MNRQTYDDPAAFRAAIAGTSRRASSRARESRPDIPRAGPSARTGLSTFLKAGWSYTCNPDYGYRLDAPDGRSSGWQSSEAACCRKARELCRVRARELEEVGP